MTKLYAEIMFWLKSFQKENELRIIHKDWSEKLGYDLFITNLEAKYQDGRKAESTGIASTKHESLIIATAELIERLVFLYYKLKSSNGLAVHTSFEKAKDNSVKELIERDSYMFHYLSLSRLILLERKNKLQACLEKYFEGVEFKSYSLSNNYGFNVIQTIAFGKNYHKPFGMIVGLAAEKDIDLAIEKSTKEILITLLNNLTTPISYNEFLRLQNIQGIKIFHHHQLALSNEYFERYFQLYLDSNSSAKSNKETFQINSEKLDIPKDILGPLNLECCLSSSSSMQQIFWGNTTFDKVNSHRFDSDLSQELEVLKDFPHPFA